MDPLVCSSATDEITVDDQQSDYPKDFPPLPANSHMAKGPTTNMKWAQSLLPSIPSSVITQVTLNN